MSWRAAWESTQEQDLSVLWRSGAMRSIGSFGQKRKRTLLEEIASPYARRCPLDKWKIERARVFATPSRCLEPRAMHQVRKTVLSCTSLSWIDPCPCGHTTWDAIGMIKVWEGQFPDARTGVKKWKRWRLCTQHHRSVAVKCSRIA